MMDDFDAFRLWTIANLHFKTEKFDFTKTKSVKDLGTRFEKLTPMERAVFRRFSIKFPDQTEFCKMLIACFLKGENPRYMPLDQMMTRYKNYMKIRESLSYQIKEDLSYIEDNITSLYELFLELDMGKISPEAVIVLDRVHGFLDKCQNEFSLLAYEPLIFTLRKYRIIYSGAKHEELYVNRVKFLTELATA